MDSEQKLNSEKWLEKENINPDSHIERIHGRGTFNLPIIMERYANEVSKEYQVKILMFREQLIDLIYKEDRYALSALLMVDSNELTEDQLKYIEVKRLLQEMQRNPIIVNYDKWFGITTQRKGEIVNGNNN